MKKDIKPFLLINSVFCIENTHRDIGFNREEQYITDRAKKLKSGSHKSLAKKRKAERQRKKKNRKRKG